MGPVQLLPVKHTSGFVPVDELPPVLSKVSRPVSYSSQWRSGIIGIVGKSSTHRIIRIKRQEIY